MKDDAVNKSRDQGSIFPPFLLLLFCFYIKKKTLHFSRSYELESFALA